MHASALHSSTRARGSFCFPGGLICGSCKQPCLESKTHVGLGASPYYTLCHKSNKMNNNLQFILRPIWSVCKTCWNNKNCTSLWTSAFDQHPPLCEHPLWRTPYCM